MQLTLSNELDIRRQYTLETWMTSHVTALESTLRVPFLSTSLVSKRAGEEEHRRRLEKRGCRYLTGGSSFLSKECAS
jgi:hypothetical protein